MEQRRKEEGERAEGVMMLKRLFDLLGKEGK